jgi:hypothetical protein
MENKSLYVYNIFENQFVPFVDTDLKEEMYDLSSYYSLQREDADSIMRWDERSNLTDDEVLMLYYGLWQAINEPVIAYSIDENLDLLEETNKRAVKP